MDELAGAGHQLVGIGIGGAFANGVQLGGIIGEKEIKEGAAIRGPASGTDAPGGQWQFAVLSAVGVDQPEGLVRLAVQNLGAVGAGLGVGEQPGHFEDGAGGAALQANVAQARGLGMALPDEDESAIAGEAESGT